MKVLTYNINSSQAELSGSFKAKQDSFIKLSYSSICHIIISMFTQALGLACGLISEWALSVLQTPEDQRDEQPVPNIDHLLSNIGRTAPLGDASGESSYSLLYSVFAASCALPKK